MYKYTIKGFTIHSSRLNKSPANIAAEVSFSRSVLQRLSTTAIYVARTSVVFAPFLFSHSRFVVETLFAKAAAAARKQNNSLPLYIRLTHG